MNIQAHSPQLFDAIRFRCIGVDILLPYIKRGDAVVQLRLSQATLLKQFLSVDCDVVYLHGYKCRWVCVSKIKAVD